MTKRVMVLFVVLFGAMGPARSLAQPATQAMDRHRAELSALLAHGDAQATELLATLVDYDAMARRILGERWETVTEAQRTGYVRALRVSLLRTYGRRVSQARDYRVRMGTEEPGEEPVVHVTARSIAAPRAEPWEIACRVHRVSGQWRVVDIVTNESSLVQAQARRVRQAMEDGTLDELIARMSRSE